MKFILSILVKNRPGVMSHVSGLFTRRSYNIDSIAVGVTADPAVSSMTIVVNGDENTLVQFRGQLLKLPDVLEVKELSYHESIVRELVLIRVKSENEKRAEIFGIVEVFGGKVDEITAETMLIEMNGSPRQVNGLIRMLNVYGIVDIARTGQIALSYQSEA